MRIILWLLSLTLFALLAVNFSQDSLPFNLSASTRSAVATTTARDSALEREEAEKDPNPRDSVAPAKPAPRPVSKPAPAQPEPAPQSTPTPEPAPSVSVAAQIEAEILRLSNIERVKVGLNSLSSNTTLAATAREHSADMLKRDYFDHDTPEGCSSSCRATDAGYKWQMIGENIYMMSGWDVSPAEAAEMVVLGWMGSPGHRENLLKDGYTETGVGVVVKGKTLYATTLYAKPR